MARKTPNPGQKITYLLLVIFGSIVFYFDFNTNFFDKIKNSYTSLKISTKFVLKENTIDRFKNIFNSVKSKQELIEENNNLRKALDISYLNNFLISKENIFYKDKNIIRFPVKNTEDELNYSLAKIKYINHNVFNCCDRHRMHIEIISNNLPSYEQSIVFNNSGIIGQIVSDEKYLEVILLTDITHAIPIKSRSEKFFCNASGSGRANLIICSYNPLVWDEEIELEKESFLLPALEAFSQKIYLWEPL